jgi:hypothetical protein
MTNLISIKTTTELMDKALKESVLDAVLQYNRVDILLVHLAEALQKKADDARETILYEEGELDTEGEADIRALHVAADMLKRTAKLAES